jgi:cyclophilin family peptidyl-prolyl cis-trans isomerase
MPRLFLAIPKHKELFMLDAKMKRKLWLCGVLVLGLSLASPRAKAQLNQTGSIEDQLIQFGSPSSQLDMGSYFNDPLLPDTDSIYEFRYYDQSVYVHMFDTQAPVTVANFANYASQGLFDDTIMHRSVNNFIVQGGGFKLTDTVDGITIDKQSGLAPIVNEFSQDRSNLRGTIAMAKLGGDPDSATNQWFFNLGNNSANLDNQNGGFTVFGEVIGSGMNYIDFIAASKERQLLDVELGVLLQENAILQTGQNTFYDVNQDGTNDANGDGFLDIEDTLDYYDYTSTNDLDGDLTGDFPYNIAGALSDVPLRNDIEPILIDTTLLTLDDPATQSNPFPQYMPLVNTRGLDSNDLFTLDTIQEVSNITYEILSDSTPIGLITDILFDENGVATLYYEPGMAGQGTVEVRATNLAGEYLDTSFEITVLGAPGDVDLDNDIDTDDLLSLTNAINGDNQAPWFDVDLSGVVDSADGVSLVTEALGHPQGDFDLDGTAGVPDLITWAKNFGQNGNFLNGDADFDGIIGVPDLIAWARIEYWDADSRNCGNLSGSPATRRLSGLRSRIATFLFFNREWVGFLLRCFF